MELLRTHPAPAAVAAAVARVSAPIRSTKAKHQPSRPRTRDLILSGQVPAERRDPDMVDVFWWLEVVSVIRFPQIVVEVRKVNDVDRQAQETPDVEALHLLMSILTCRRQTCVA